ncbi:hypothetical protein CB1_000818022 [Camelus ferus]|nr:hypothetical protein CB1_000818022 [Camelus ferus]
MFWKISMSLLLVAALGKLEEIQGARPAGAIPSPRKDRGTNNSQNWQHIREVLSSSQEALVVTERRYLRRDWCKTQRLRQTASSSQPSSLRSLAAVPLTHLGAAPPEPGCEALKKVLENPRRRQEPSGRRSRSSVAVPQNEEADLSLLWPDGVKGTSTPTTEAKAQTGFLVYASVSYVHDWGLQVKLKISFLEKVYLIF